MINVKIVRHFAKINLYFTINNNTKDHNIIYYMVEFLDKGTI